MAYVPHRLWFSRLALVSREWYYATLIPLYREIVIFFCFCKSLVALSRAHKSHGDLVHVLVTDTRVATLRQRLCAHTIYHT